METKTKMKIPAVRAQRLRTLVGALLAVFLLGHSLPAGAIDEAGRAEIEAIVHEYLVENPEILREIAEALKVKEEARAETETLTQLAKNRAALEGGDPAFIGGNPEGTISLVEFFDYKCGYCRRAVQDVDQLIEKDSELRVVFKEFPILGPVSLYASRAAIAARHQGKYLEFHHGLLTSGASLNEGLVLQIAEDVGLDVARLKEDMKQSDVQAIIDQNFAVARSLDITGTPSFIIGDQLLPGAVGYDILRAAIDTARKTCSTC